MHLTNAFVFSQPIVALSSGEAEMYGLVTTCGHVILTRNILRSLGADVKIRLRVDSAAAKGMA